MTAGAIDHAAQDGEKPRRAMHLVQDDQFILVIGQIEFGLDELGAILFGFEVEVMGVKPLTDFQGQGGLAHLARAKQGYGRGLSKGLLQVSG